MSAVIRTNVDIGNQLSKSKNPNASLIKVLHNNKVVPLYTDASKTTDSDSTGCACLCHELNIIKQESLSKNASIFTAECFALNLALDIIQNKPDLNYFILTDSLSSIQALKNNKINTKVNPYIISIRRKYLEITQNNSCNITFVWIPSHSGIMGNEEADFLAKQAAQSITNSSALLPYTDFREKFSSNANLSTKNLVKVQGLRKGKIFFENFDNDKLKPWYHNINQPREFIATINRCRSNHYTLAASLGRIGIIESCKCNCGCDIQDLNHVIWQCPIFDRQRINLIKSLMKLNEYPPFNITNFLASLDIQALLCIHDFLKKCGLNI